MTGLVRAEIIGSSDNFETKVALESPGVTLSS